MILECKRADYLRLCSTSPAIGAVPRGPAQRPCTALLLPSHRTHRAITPISPEARGHHTSTGETAGPMGLRPPPTPLLPGPCIAHPPWRHWALLSCEDRRGRA